MSRRSDARKDSDVNQGDEDCKRGYGNHAIVTRVGQIRIIHLDRPSQATIEARIREVIREEIRDEAFEPDCSLCREMKSHPYDVVYDESVTSEGRTIDCTTL